METTHKLTLHLSELQFFGHYGLYPVESKWTTELIIDLSIQFQLPVTESIELKDTIDYNEIYQIVENIMKDDHQLLETIATQLINNLKNADKRIIHCKVRISKKPQLAGPLKNVAIELEY